MPDTTASQHLVFELHNSNFTTRIRSPINLSRLRDDFCTVPAERYDACARCIFLFTARAARPGGNPHHCSRVFFTRRLWTLFVWSSTTRSRPSGGLCYDQHQVWTVTVAVTLPETLPCVLRGGGGSVGKGNSSPECLASYPALWDSATSVSLHKLFACIMPRMARRHAPARTDAAIIA
jgi:hypothetical protein